MWGYRSLGERDGHMAPPFFHNSTHLFQKEKTDRDRYMEPCPKSVPNWGMSTLPSGQKVGNQVFDKERNPRKGHWL